MSVLDSLHTSIHVLASVASARQVYVFLRRQNNNNVWYNWKKCICICVCMYRMYASMYVCMYVCMYVKGVCMYPCIYECMHVFASSLGCMNEYLAIGYGGCFVEIVVAH